MAWREKLLIKSSEGFHLDPENVTFSVFTNDDIRKLSVKKITTPLSFNILGHPLIGGLYDPALGPVSETSDACGTCGYGIAKCPGHFGHIELPIPVVNPLFHKTLTTILRLSCLRCYTLQIPSYKKLLLIAKFNLLQEGFYDRADDLEREVYNAVNAHNVGNSKDGNLIFIKDVIDSFMQTLRNKERHRKETLPYDIFDDKTSATTWRFYVDGIIKENYAQKNCIYCYERISKITSLKNRIMTTKIDTASDGGTIKKLEPVPLTPEQTKEYLRKLWQNDKDVLKLLVPCLSKDCEYPTDVIFFDAVPVLPPNVRPANILNGQVVEHPQTQVYKLIIQDCLLLRNTIQVIQDGNPNNLPDEGRRIFDQMRGDTAFEKLQNAWINLQMNIDHLMDREMSKTSDSNSCQGLKQVIEKKEGIIRMHMMGKRVNFAARSVVTPDPNINIDEIGIPETFAKKLTYPVPVTPWNVAEMRQLILNGPDVHPGAVLIEGEDGFIKRIPPNDKISRQAIAKRLLTMTDKANKFFHGIKIVHRHLQNGDVLLLNRQPTLHKPSIMAHKARILRGEKTLRLHYANCKAYNADFDGDEMNAHFPQSELARAEGYLIANVSNQYLVPKDGTPLSGLIQDHMIGGVKMSLRGRFFTKADYMQLVFSALSIIKGDIILLPPAILKPARLWSGKQIISTIIINILPRDKPRINLTSTSKIGPKEWQVVTPRRWKCGTLFSDPKTMSEAEVIIRHGELLCGILDKKHYGATQFGLVHCVYELYGGNYSSTILSAFGKVFQAFLQRHGFTLGVEDILVTPEADKRRREIIEECQQIGESIQKSILELPEDTPREEVILKFQEAQQKIPKFTAIVDKKYKSVSDVYTNDINKACLPLGLIQKFPHNNLQLMVQSGAKGSTVNTMQISCLLGQIELEGKRPPVMISGKSLPCFKAYDPSPRAGGFIDQRFMTGIKPPEFFFHCMAGREGLIDTAVKTSRSGYLQRCLIKHLEGISVNYDSTVRDSDGSLIQLQYGEDGLDISNSRFLSKDNFSFLIDNKDLIVDPDVLSNLKNHSETSKISKMSRKIRKWKKKFGDPIAKRRTSVFTSFSADNADEVISKLQSIHPSYGRSRGAISLMKKWIRADEETKKHYTELCARCPDPINSKFRMDLEFGVLTEKLERVIDDYMNSTKVSMKKEEVRDVICSKFMKSLSVPGEPVGLLAAQSIGEPSTQMTLNTFHFAGRGEMNVTLGIPRLREILMQASRNIKTPSMEIPFKTDVPNLDKLANKLRIKLARCYTADVLKDITINRKLQLAPERQLTFSVTLEFLPQKYYKNEFCIIPKDVLPRIEKVFLKEFFRQVKKATKVAGAMIHFAEEKQKKDSEIDDEGDNEVRSKTKRFNTAEDHQSSDEEEANADADATQARSVAKHQENQEYEDPEEEEVEKDDDEIEENAENENGENADRPLDAEDEDEMDTDAPVLSDAERLIYEDRKKNVISTYYHVTDYDYDNRKHLWCKFDFWLPLKMIKVDIPTIVRQVAESVVLWEVPRINRAFTYQNQKGETILKTDGINVEEMFKYEEILEINRLYSNDIWGVSQSYGIEAAYRVIIREVLDVFRVYGISVDPRHLSLIADYMTYDGTFKPLSRKGMEDSASPLQQMSFESSLNFLRTATLLGKRDHLDSPSSCLMIGKPCKVGTGSFDVLADIQKILTQNVTRPQTVVAAS